MEYLGFWVTFDRIKAIDKKIQALKYETTYLLKGITPFYMCSGILPRYVGKTFTYVSAFN